MSQVTAAIPHLVEAVPGWLAEAGVPGLSLALVEDARLAWAAGFGLRDSATGDPVTPETVFEAASITKPVFACLVLQLAQAGRLDLDAPLSRCLPEPYLPGDPHLEAITARRVLCHTSGLPNWGSDEHPLRAHFPPGQRFSYSGEGYVYLQKAVERITGQPLAELARAGVLAPLGMASSSFIWDERFAERAATGHDEQGRPREKRKMEQANAAYTLVTTPTDLARYLAALLQTDPPAGRLLDQVTLDAMLTPQVPANDLAPWHDGWPDGPYRQFENVFWGLGWGIQRQGSEEAFFHWGDNGDAHAFAIAFRHSRSGMVAMANSANGLRLWRRLFSAVFGEDLPALEWLAAMYHLTP